MRHLALAVLLFRGAALAAPGCAPLPACTEEQVSTEKCCTAVTGPNALWISSFAARTGVTDSLTAQLATASAPINEQEVKELLGGVSSVTGKPAPPALFSGSKRKVDVGLKVFRVTNINQKAQTITLHYKLTWMWQDCRLLFNCSSRLFVDDGHMYFDNFWRPAWRIAEMEDTLEYMTTRSHMIFGSGWDIYNEERVSTFKCSLNFQDVPMDKQSCTLTLTIPGIFASELELAWSGISSEKLTNAEWKLTQGGEWSQMNRTANRGGLWEGGPVIFESELETSFEMTRDSGYLVKQFVTPAILFYLLSLLGLFLDVGAVPARVAAAIIPALTTSNKMNALAAILPPISYSTRLDSFMSMTLILIVIHALVYGFSHWAARRKKALEAKDKDLQAKAKDAFETTDPNLVPVHHESSLAKFERKMAFWVNDYLEATLRIVSPLVYLIAGCVLFS